MDVYKHCPQYNGLRYSLRIVEKNDCDDLLKVYSDVKSVPFFNSDNCYGDDFHYTTTEEIMNAIDFWIEKYYPNERRHRSDGSGSSGAAGQLPDSAPGPGGQRPGL